MQSGKFRTLPNVELMKFC
uniref:Uncharacterized protein n=1 Tax=Arundo donax TaxID=35708 RepID=A0A0A8Y2U2_ARUDO